MFTLAKSVKLMEKQENRTRTTGVQLKPFIILCGRIALQYLQIYLYFDFTQHRIKFGARYKYTSYRAKIGTVKGKQVDDVSQK